MAKQKILELWFPWSPEVAGIKEEELGHIHNRPFAQVLARIDRETDWSCRQVYFTQRDRCYREEHDGLENLLFPVSLKSWGRSKQGGRQLSLTALKHLATAPLGCVAFFQAHGRFPQLGARICERRGIPYIVIIGAWYAKYTEPQARYFGNAARLLAHTKMQLDALAELGHSRHNMEVFPIGVDTNLFSLKSEASREPSSDYPRLLYVGRMYAFKGAPQALQAFVSVRHRYPNATLRMVGPPGDDATMNGMHSFIEGHDLSQSVSIETGVDHRLLPGIYREADLLVYPSMYEGLPQVVLESMASGTPVLAVHGEAGTAEVIDHGKDSWIVNMPDLTYALIEILDDRERLVLAGERASAKIRERYSTERHFQQIRTIFREIDALSKQGQVARMRQAITPSHTRRG
jgi:glycosyltransferase involved in cell wall biosynthesis